MHDESNPRLETVKKLISLFDSAKVADFAPKSEEKIYREVRPNGLTRDDCMKGIRQDMDLLGDGLSSLSNIHPAWIAMELEKESPKIIGIILRWLPSASVRYILDNIPKRIKLSLPKLVESFAVPTPILRLIKEGFEKKFADAINEPVEVRSFEDIPSLCSQDLEELFKDIGLHELAMAFHNIESDSMKVLLNRMSVSTARGLQRRMKGVVDEAPELLKDARYTILDVAMDQSDIDKLVREIGIAAFSKAVLSEEFFAKIKLKLEPVVSYVLQRYIEQYSGVSKLAKKRQELILKRIAVLSKAKERINEFLG